MGHIHLVKTQKLFPAVIDSLQKPTGEITKIFLSKWTVTKVVTISTSYRPNPSGSISDRSGPAQLPRLNGPSAMEGKAQVHSAWSKAHPNSETECLMVAGVEFLNTHPHTQIQTHTHTHTLTQSLFGFHTSQNHYPAAPSLTRRTEPPSACDIPRWCMETSPFAPCSK